MCGKSAHGRSGKVGYYEHSWAMRKNSTLSKKELDCGMLKRVPAKKLEPLVDKLVFDLISTNEFAREIIEEAQKIHKENYSVKALLLSVKKEISSYNAQTDALAERISKLPLNVPVEPLYRMLTKLQTEKERAETELRELNSKNGIGIDTPAEIDDYLSFTSAFKALWESEDIISSEIKSRIIKKLIAKIEISEKGATIYYYVGKNQIKKESILDSFFNDSQTTDFIENSKKNSQNSGSRTCNTG